MYVKSYQFILGGVGYAPASRDILGFTPRKVVSEAILGHLKLFLNTVHRTVCCNCACVLQLG